VFAASGWVFLAKPSLSSSSSCSSDGGGSFPAPAGSTKTAERSGQEMFRGGLAAAGGNGGSSKRGGRGLFAMVCVRSRSVGNTPLPSWAGVVKPAQIGAAIGISSSTATCLNSVPLHARESLGRTGGEPRWEPSRTLPFGNGVSGGERSQTGLPEKPVPGRDGRPETPRRRGFVSPGKKERQSRTTPYIGLFPDCGYCQIEGSYDPQARLKACGRGSAASVRGRDHARR